MKKSAFVLIFIIFSLGSALYAEEGPVRIYHYADPGMLGRSPDRSRIASVNLKDFSQGTPVLLENPVQTAYLINASVIEQLKILTKNGGRGETPQLKAQRLAPRTYKITFPFWNIENIYRFDPPGPGLESVIQDFYSNVYWREIVSGEYDSNYTVTVIQAMDIQNPRGSIEYTEVLLAAALIASKNQPLWGIHDGSGLLDGLGYALAEAQNKSAHETYNYREFSENKSQMQELVLRLMQNDTELSSTLHTMVKSLVQFEKDDTFLLPEELIEYGEGDCLEFALCYYDLLRRIGCEVKVLALRPEEDYPGELPCDFITVYRNEDFAPWGFIHYGNYAPVSFETWEEIPGHILRDTAYYYPIDPEECMRDRSVYLPNPEIWPASNY